MLRQLIFALVVLVLAAVRPRQPGGGGDGPSGRPRDGDGPGGRPRVRVVPVSDLEGGFTQVETRLRAGVPPQRGVGTATALPRDSRGRVIPPEVERLPSGRLPANWHHHGDIFDGDTWTPDLQARYPDGVRFTNDGYPDFSPYATHTVRFDPPGFQGNHGTDFTDANRAANLPETPDGYTWHHHQDGHTMQLVPTEVHDAVRHAGGVAIKKGG
jgi:hypothetical protein